MKDPFIVKHFENDDEMRAFVRACDRNFDAQILDIAEQINQVPNLRIIGLTGPTCSGKTTAAKKLIEEIEKSGREVHMISIDDFYYEKVILEERAKKDPRITIDFDSEDTIDHELLNSAISSLLRNQKTQLPCFDFKTGLRGNGDVLTPDGDDLFLFEGIQILYPKISKILNREVYRSIFIQPETPIFTGGQLFLPDEFRFFRRLVRDYLFRNSGPDFTYFLWESVRKNEIESILPNLDRCDFFIDSSMYYEIGMLLPEMKKLLGGIPSDSPYFSAASSALEKIRQVQPIPVGYLTEKSIYKEFIK